jgi:hypothetical protein
MDLKGYKYTEEVLKYVRFKYDHYDIRKELNEHIEDMLQDAPEMEEDKIDEYILEHMGDPEELGMELDKEHKPLLGWTYRISRWILIFMIIINIPNAINLALTLGYTGIKLVVGYDVSEEPEYTIKTDLRGQIDDIYIFVEELNKYEDGTVEVRYKTIHNPFGKSQGWTFDFAGCFYDEFGNQYYGGGSDTGGFIRYHISQFDDFNENAQKLIIDYDYNGRKFYGEIPLEWEAVK